MFAALSAGWLLLHAPAHVLHQAPVAARARPPPGRRQPQRPPGEPGRLISLRVTAAIWLLSTHRSSNLISNICVLPNVRRSRTADVQTPMWGMTPLHMACEAGDLPAVRALVAAGARVNALAWFKTFGAFPIVLQASPLACAARSGYADVASFLMDSGADPNLRDLTDLVRSSARGVTVAAAGVSAWWRAQLRTALAPGRRRRKRGVRRAREGDPTCCRHSLRPPHCWLSAARFLLRRPGVARHAPDGGHHLRLPGGGEAAAGQARLAGRRHQRGGLHARACQRPGARAFSGMQPRGTERSWEAAAPRMHLFARLRAALAHCVCVCASCIDGTGHLLREGSGARQMRR